MLPLLYLSEITGSATGREVGLDTDTAAIVLEEEVSVMIAEAPEEVEALVYMQLEEEPSVVVTIAELTELPEAADISAS